MELFLWLAVLFALSLVLGILLERLKIPWLFAPLFIGILANWFGIRIDDQGILEFLASIGMYFLLFLIGFELDLEEFRKLGKKIIESTIAINIASSLLGFLVLIYLDYPPLISLIVGIAMSTVGEAVLAPILKEFGLMRTKLGTMIVGIGIFDDAFEVVAMVLAGTLVASGAATRVHILAILVGVLLLVLLTMAFVYIRGLRAITRRVPEVEDLFLIGLTILFAYLAIGKVSGAEGLGAILAGISMRNLVPNKELKNAQFAMESMAYGLFGPLFFSWVGMGLHFSSQAITLTVILYFVAMLAKIVASWFTTVRELGKGPALVLGIALSVRFSTELVIAQFLLSSGVIDTLLFTAIVASSALATIINPLLMILAMGKLGVR